MNKLLILSAVLSILIIVHKAVNSGHPFFKSVVNIIEGISTLAVLEFACSFAFVEFPLNVLTVVFSLLLGLPGITTILALNLIMS